ncbi:M48 family metalloprotease [Streptosporangium algeriense]|uniref:M48 family metalloprotease n=1 Tax=Streptosporangium algeriense TaxID=1682748 RepID=A0ABW3DJ20_9ACTN
MFETGLPIGAAGALIALAQLPLRPLSRYRELAADRGAAVQLGHPALLASALQKVHPAADAEPRVLRLPALGLVPPRLARFPRLSVHSSLAQRMNGLKALTRE